jgi:co-chaperonin GroES (HSP10)
MAGIRDLIVIGDRVLIRPADESDRTEHGLYLPAGVRSREQVQSGRIMKVGPGYPVPDMMMDSDEPWAQEEKESVRYVPLQAQPGDYALFLREKAIEIEYEGEKLLIVPQSSLLVLVRRDPLEELGQPSPEDTE